MTTELEVTESSGTPAADDQLTISGDTLVVTVGDGRSLTLTYPGPLAQFDLVNAMGADAADNARLVRMFLPLIYLSQINEERVPLPSSLLQMRALVNRLGHKGLAALQRGVQAFNERDEDETIAQAKK
jgi:hypothetical protein